MEAGGDGSARAGLGACFGLLECWVLGACGLRVCSVASRVARAPLFVSALFRRPRLASAVSPSHRHSRPASPPHRLSRLTAFPASPRLATLCLVSNLVFFPVLPLYPFCARPLRLSVAPAICDSRCTTHDSDSQLVYLFRSPPLFSPPSLGLVFALVLDLMLSALMLRRTVLCRGTARGCAWLMMFTFTIFPSSQLTLPLEIPPSAPDSRSRALESRNW